MGLEFLCVRSPKILRERCLYYITQEAETSIIMNESLGIKFVWSEHVLIGFVWLEKKMVA